MPPASWPGPSPLGTSCRHTMTVTSRDAQGAPDIFMNILSDTAYCSRFLTDWAGPDAMISKLAIRLGVPIFPGHTLTFTGSVTGLRPDGGEGVIEITFTGAGDLGAHVSGTAEVRLPLGAAPA